MSSTQNKLAVILANSEENFIAAVSAMINLAAHTIELETAAMVAENKYRSDNGNSIAYTEDGFYASERRIEEQLINALVRLLCSRTGVNEEWLRGQMETV